MRISDWSSDVCSSDLISGGTLHAASEICKLDTQLPDSVAVIRSNNPSTTLGPAFFNSPVGTVKDTVRTVHDVDAPPGFNPFTIRPGESVLLREDVGAVGHLWNVSRLWREVSRPLLFRTSADRRGGEGGVG